jgi:Zn-finger nucleic acid-binding protein
MGDMPLRRCPRDGSGLSSRELDGIAYLFCDRCHGLLLHPAAIEQLKARSLGGQRPPRSTNRGIAIHEGTVRCPCGPLMTNVAKGAVVLDVCRECGAIWLDGGEVADFLRPFTVSPGANLRSSPSGDGGGALEAIGVVADLLSVIVEFGL